MAFSLLLRSHSKTIFHVYVGFPCPWPLSSPSSSPIHPPARAHGQLLYSRRGQAHGQAQIQPRALKHACLASALSSLCLELELAWPLNHRHPPAGCTSTLICAYQPRPTDPDPGTGAWPLPPHAATSGRGCNWLSVVPPSSAAVHVYVHTVHVVIWDNLRDGGFCYPRR